MERTTSKCASKFQIEQFQGIPYVWGGTDPATGLDCWGLARHIRETLDPECKLPQQYNEISQQISEKKFKSIVLLNYFHQHCDEVIYPQHLDFLLAKIAGTIPRYWIVTTLVQAEDELLLFSMTPEGSSCRPFRDTVYGFKEYRIFRYEQPRT